MKIANYSLGLDLGPTSIGWAMVEPAENPVRIVRVGSRIFPLGGQESGKSGIRSTRAARGVARRARRTIARRKERKESTFKALQEAGFFPNDVSPTSLGRNEYLLQLDRRIAARYAEDLAGEEREVFREAMMVWLRVFALSNEIPLEELGKILYYFASQRGYKEPETSDNRENEEEDDAEKPSKARRKKETELGEEEDRVKLFEERVRAVGTLGQFYLQVAIARHRDPEHAPRIRGKIFRPTRDLVNEELRLIWQRQCQYPGREAMLSDVNRENILGKLLFQRPLKSPAKYVGYCSIFPKEKRLGRFTELAQEFQVLQAVGNLRWRDQYGRWHALSPDERERAIHFLSTRTSTTPAKLHAAIGLEKKQRLNVQLDEEKVVPGDKLRGLICETIGEEEWFGLGELGQGMLVDALRRVNRQKGRKKQALRWLLKPSGMAKPPQQPLEELEQQATPEQIKKAEAFARLKKFSGYSALSKKALEAIVPLMRGGSGLDFYGARSTVAAENPDEIVWEILPSVHEALPALDNHSVERTLSQLRQLINELIRVYGKPALITVELVRELGKGPKARKEISMLQAARRKRNETVLSKIMELEGASDRSKLNAALRYRLYEEGNHTCPYCLATLTKAAAFKSTETEIDHMLPLSRFRDDSYNNKVLCCVKCNQLKGARTPSEAFDSAPGWEAKVDAIKGIRVYPPLKGKDHVRELERIRSAKLFRFTLADEELEEYEQKLSSGMLVDTGFITTQARKFLGLLYGPESQLHVRASSGSVTGFLRNAWGTNKIMADLISDWLSLEEAAEEELSPNKRHAQARPESRKFNKRVDHRHHALDALVLALTTPSLVRAATLEARTNEESGRRATKGITLPWETFIENATEAFRSFHVSHARIRKLRGPLHAENALRVRSSNDGTPNVPKQRVPVEKLTPGQLECIDDKRIRNLILGMLKGRDAAEVFSSNLEHTLPVHIDKNGKKTLLRHVMVCKADKYFSVGTVESFRYMTNDENSHVEIYQEGEGESAKWKGDVVDRFTAQTRILRGESLFREVDKQGRRLKFVLFRGDTLLMADANGNEWLVVVQKISQDKKGAVSIVVLDAKDARPVTKISPKGRKFPPETLRKRSARPVIVDVTGELKVAP